MEGESLDSLKRERDHRKRAEIARGAANTWCRCFKCDGIINATKEKCDQSKLNTCLKWYNSYRACLIALADDRVKIED